MKLKGKYVCTLEMNFDMDIPKDGEAERIKDKIYNEFTEGLREAIYENIVNEEECEVIVTQQCCDIDVKED